jgi:hypothetical protein
VWTRPRRAGRWHHGLAVGGRAGRVRLRISFSLCGILRRAPCDAFRTFEYRDLPVGVGSARARARARGEGEAGEGDACDVSALPGLSPLIAMNTTCARGGCGVVWVSGGNLFPDENENITARRGIVPRWGREEMMRFTRTGAGALLSALLVTTAAASPLVTAPAHAQDSPPSPGTRTETVRTETISCRTSSYTGTAQVTFTVSESGATFVVNNYKLNNSDGTDGWRADRDNANVNSRVTDSRADGGVRTKDAYSEDTMEQDELWHTLNQSVTLDVTDTAAVYTGQVEFIFDRPKGDDPRCTATLPASLALPADSGLYSPIVSSPTGEAQECVVPAWKGTPCWMYEGPGSIVVDVRSTTGSAAVSVKRQGEKKLYNLEADKDYRFELSFGDSISGVGQPDPETLQVKVPGGRLPE